MVRGTPTGHPYPVGPNVFFCVRNTQQRIPVGLFACCPGRDAAGFRPAFGSNGLPESRGVAVETELEASSPLLNQGSNHCLSNLRFVSEAI